MPKKVLFVGVPPKIEQYDQLLVDICYTSVPAIKRFGTPAFIAAIRNLFVPEQKTATKASEKIFTSRMKESGTELPKYESLSFGVPGTRNTDISDLTEKEIIRLQLVKATTFLFNTCHQITRPRGSSASEWHRTVQFDAIELNFIEYTKQGSFAKNLFKHFDLTEYLQVVSSIVERMEVPQVYKNTFIESMKKGYLQKTDDDNISKAAIRAILNVREAVKEQLNALTKFVKENYRNYLSKREVANLYNHCYYNYKLGRHFDNEHAVDINKREEVKEPPKPKVATQERTRVFKTTPQQKAPATKSNGKRKPYFLPETMKFMNKSIIVTIFEESQCTWQEFDGRIVYSATDEQQEVVRTKLNNLFEMILADKEEVEAQA